MTNARKTHPHIFHIWMLIVLLSSGTLIYAGDGDLDTTFSSDGVLARSIGSNTGQIRGSVVQPDGKIIVVGGVGSYFATVRYNADGSLDSSFDEDGRVITFFALTAPASTPDVAYAVAVQSDGKIIVVGSARMGVNNDDFAVIRLNPDGSLDTTFDLDGKITTPIGTGSDVATCVAIQPDGKIVVGGYYRASNDDFALVRYNTDGSLDTTFDGDGKAQTPITNNDQAFSIALQSDGKIVLGGTNGSVFALARYNSDGTLDTSFSGDGKQTVAQTAIGRSVKIQSDGKIIMAGLSSTTTQRFAVVRLDSTGTLDTTFDTDGRVTTTIGTSSHAYSLEIRPSGKLVAGGFSTTEGFTVVQYNSNGSIDVSFDTDGIATSTLGGDNLGYTGFLQSDDRYVLAGTSNSNFAIARFNTDGSLDTAFDNDGIVTTAEVSGNSYVNDLAIQNDGKILVSGYAGGLVSDRSCFIARFLANGSIDLTFGINGVVRSRRTIDSSLGCPIELLSDGKIALAMSTVNSSDVVEFAVARFNSDGTLDTTFDLDGYSTTIVGTEVLFLRAFKAQSDGKLVIAGDYLDPAPRNAILRYNSDGTLDTTFDADGIVTVPQDYHIRALKFQNDGKLVAGGYFLLSQYDLAVLRFDPNGDLDTSFDNDGIFTTSLVNTETLSDLAIQSDGKIVAVGNVTNGSFTDSVMIRLNPSGVLDTSFDTDGKVVTAVSTNNDGSTSIAIQADGKLVVTGFATIGANNEFVAARYNEDGTLDSAGVVGNSQDLFGTGGIATPATGRNSFSYSILLQDDGKILLGGQANGSMAVARLLSSLGPTAANVSISGRVFSPSGNGLKNAVVTLTDSNGRTFSARTGSFGFFRFDEIESGQTVVVTVMSKLYQFDARVITVAEEITDLDFSPMKGSSPLPRL